MLVIQYVTTTSFIKYCWRLQLDLAIPTLSSNLDLISFPSFVFQMDNRYLLQLLAKRATLTDSNSWNHEPWTHRTVGYKVLATDLDSGYKIACHLADYVLVWGGGGSDDLAKSPHLARIAKSVYCDHCPNDPTCCAFGFIARQDAPSSMMICGLLLYGLHGNNQIKPDAIVP